MTRRILVLNSGSSSIKYRVFDFQDGERVVAAGRVERIGEPAETGRTPVTDHGAALESLVQVLQESGVLTGTAPLRAIGHRVVHGGETFNAATRVDDTVIAAIRAAIPLAPLHNPPNLLGIEVCRKRWPDIPQVAVFDTAFHQTMPPEAFRYALPEAYYREFHIRRYGFHGTSFAYVTARVATHLAVPVECLNLIVLHLGNGASAAAIRGGRSVDTSMGMTPLAGLVMGTRCGDLDPGVLLHLMEQRGLSAKDLTRLLNQESGLKGLAGSNDMRDILSRAESGDLEAKQALAIYVYRLKAYIGAYLAVLGRVDALVFTGGIGEHAPTVRRDVCAGLEPFGFCLDVAANDRVQAGISAIESAGSPARVLVVSTDEELEIARQTASLVGSSA